MTEVTVVGGGLAGLTGCTLRARRAAFRQLLILDNRANSRLETGHQPAAHGVKRVLEMTRPPAVR